MNRFTPLSFATVTRSKKASVDGFAQFRIQLEAGVVRNAREMNHRIAPRHGALQQPPVADVALDLFQRWVARDRLQHVVAIQVEIQHPHAISVLEKVRYEHGADVPGAASHKHALL